MTELIHERCSRSQSKPGGLTLARNPSQQYLGAYVAYRPKNEVYLDVGTYAVGSVVMSLRPKGWPMALLWEGFFGLFIFNIVLIIALQRWKLTPPPDLT